MSRTNLQNRRVAAGFSQERLASESGISVNTIRHYEHKIRNIEDANIRTLLKISSVLGCRYYELFDDLRLMDLASRNISV